MIDPKRALSRKFMAEALVEWMLFEEFAATKAPAQSVTWGNLSATLRTQQAQSTAKKVLGNAAKIGLGFLPGVVGQVAGIAAEAVPLIFQSDKAKDPRLKALDIDDAYNVLKLDILSAFVRYIGPTINKYAQDPALAQKPIDPQWMNNAMHDWLKRTYSIELRKQGTATMPVIQKTTR